MVFGNRLIDIHSFWRSTIRIAKIAIRFSTIDFRAVLPVNNLLVHRIWPASSWPRDSLYLKS